MKVQIYLSEENTRIFGCVIESTGRTLEVLRI